MADPAFDIHSVLAQACIQTCVASTGQTPAQCQASCTPANANDNSWGILQWAGLIAIVGGISYTGWRAYKFHQSSPKAQWVTHHAGRAIRATGRGAKRLATS